VKEFGKPKLKLQQEKAPACSVLITCSEPGADGAMQVDFSYEGDETLVSYLLGSAQLWLDEEHGADDDRRLN
jgi:hypothetical protein